MPRRRSRLWVISALPLLLPLAGCESFAHGVTQAVMEGTQGETQDTRNCEIEGRPFPGIEPYLQAQDERPPFGEDVGQRPEVKVLFVHGIGTHAPGHGTALRQNGSVKNLGQAACLFRADRPG